MKEQNKETGMEKYFFRASADDFKKIPGSPIAYWASDMILTIFSKSKSLGSIGKIGKGSDTGKNDRFIRIWSEISFDKIELNCADVKHTFNTTKKFYPTHKGGGFRKWFGNRINVVNWKNDGKEIRNIPGSTIRNHNYYFKPCISWGKITSSKLSVREVPGGSISDDAGPSAFLGHLNLAIMGFMNSSLAEKLISFVSPTLNFQVGDISSLPILQYCEEVDEKHKYIIENIVNLSKVDWDSYETSWDFTTLPLLHPDYRQPTLEATYQQLRAQWQEMTLEMQRLEEENNRIFIEAYGLQDELTPEVPLNEITLTCNPHYRYGSNKTEDELEALLLADTMKEFISYAVGCMFGRYSLDKPGLILANQRETIEDYYRKLREPQIDTDTHGSEKQKEEIRVHPCSSVVQPTFEPDADNVIPILDGDWFIDDIVERFRIFLRITFGEEHYEENLKFIEDAIGKDIRKYFLKNFYTDHVKRYKKRPIYWLFSSPRGSFNALIYMHRYQPDTVSIILNDYLREFRTKLIARREHLEQVSISASAKKTEKTRALKEIEKLKKTIEELDTYENEILYPLATEKIEIDLDDGVKVNYKKFGKALKKVTGLS